MFGGRGEDDVGDADGEDEKGDYDHCGVWLHDRQYSCFIRSLLI